MFKYCIIIKIWGDIVCIVFVRVIVLVSVFFFFLDFVVVFVIILINVFGDLILMDYKVFYFVN